MSDALSQIDGDDDDSTADTGAEPSEEVAPPGSEEGAASDSAAEPKKEGEDKPKEPTPEELAHKNRFKLVEQAKREQIKASQAMRSAKEQAARIADQLSYREQQLMAQQQQVAAEREEMQRFKKALSERDLKTLEGFGLNYVDLTRHHLEANTPEAIARQAMAEAAALKKQLEERDSKAQQTSQAEAQVQERRHMANTLVQIVEESPGDWKDLYAWSPERIAQEGLGVREALLKRDGRSPTYEQVLGYLSKAATLEADTRKARLEKLESQAVSGSKQDTRAQAGTPGAPTLSNAQAAQKATPPRKLSEQEEDEYWIQQLEVARKSKG